jgi:hypothetical protein
MPSSGMSCLFALVTTEVSEEPIASIIMVTRIGELGTTLAVSSNRSTLLVTAKLVLSSPIIVTLMMDAMRSSEMSVLTRALRRNIPEEVIPHCVFLVIYSYGRWKSKFLNQLVLSVLDRSQNTLYSTLYNHI